MAVLWHIRRTNVNTGAEHYVRRVSETEIKQLVYNSLTDIGEHPTMAKACALTALHLLKDGETYARYQYRFEVEEVE